MTERVIVHVVIDDAKPLGPQILAARAQHVPWKVLENILGLSRQLLAHYAERDRICEFANDARPERGAQCARSAG